MDTRWQTVRSWIEAEFSEVASPAPTALHVLAILDSLEAEMEREKRGHEEMIAQFTDAAIHLTRAEAEMERLRGRLKASGVIDLMQRAERAEAEVERLREALGDGIDFATDTDDPVLLAWAERARAALGGDE